MADKHQRKVRNFLLQPLLQVKLGLYSIALAFTFSVMIASLLYLNFYRFYDMILELTDLREEVSGLLDTYIIDSTWWIFGLVVLYLVVTITVSITYTHKLVGPSYAFRRHIANLERGEYASRVVLRKNDAFLEVAAGLNSLAETLEKKYGRDTK